nr:hypothetical protein [Tanacetum cinerariifolium]
LRDMTVYYRFTISTFHVKIVIRLSAFILEYLLQLPISPALYFTQIYEFHSTFVLTLLSMYLRLQAEEQDELTDAEKEKLFMQFLEKRRKFFAAKRAGEKRNRPPTQGQQRKIMCTYFKNMEGKKLIDLKNEYFDSIQKMFDGGFKRKVEDDKESEELKKCLEIIPDDGDDVTINATPLSSKEDLEVLWRLVKARFEKVKSVYHMDSFLLHNLKTKFEHHVEDNNILYYLLVEKMYPLTNHTLHQMFNDVKLQVNYECEMAYELLRLVKKQLKEGYVSQ